VLNVDAGSVQQASEIGDDETSSFKLQTSGKLQPLNSKGRSGMTRAVTIPALRVRRHLSIDAKYSRRGLLENALLASPSRRFNDEGHNI
jgi:hypothetical protein